MSNSSVPKPQPNPLRQETLEKVLETLRQPIAIAAIGSIVAHGLLLAALPNLLTEQRQEPDSKQIVGLVELSPAEQSQLPQFATNPVPQTILPSEPLKTARSASKLPDPKRYNNPSLYDIPILQPPPPFILPSFDSPTSELDVKKPSSTSKSRKPTSPDKSTPPKPPTSPKTTTEDKGTAGTKDDSSAPARSDKLSPQQLAALREDAEKTRQLQSLYAFNGSELDEGKRIGVIFPANVDAFENAVAKATNGNYDNANYRKAPEKVEIPFPKEACSVMKEPFSKKLLNASVAAYVKPDGKLGSKPELLLTSGFNGLDQVAIDYVNSKTFKPSDKSRLVRFDFIFDPRSVCPKSSNAA